MLAVNARLNFDVSHPVDSPFTRRCKAKECMGHDKWITKTTADVITVLLQTETVEIYHINFHSEASDDCDEMKELIPGINVNAQIWLFPLCDGKRFAVIVVVKDEYYMVWILLLVLLITLKSWTGHNVLVHFSGY